MAILNGYFTRSPFDHEAMNSEISRPRFTYASLANESIDALSIFWPS